MMNIYEYLTVFVAFLIILAPAAMVAVAMGMTFGFIEVTFGILEMTFGFTSFASGSVEMTFDAVGGVLRMGGDGLGLVRSTRGFPRRHS